MPSSKTLVPTVLVETPQRGEIYTAQGNALGKPGRVGNIFIVAHHFVPHYGGQNKKRCPEALPKGRFAHPT